MTELTITGLQQERFWERVSRGEGCWEWMGCRTGSGYGYIRVNGRGIGTHRVAYLLECGPIADGLHVTHQCDNPACCNPDHLKLGDRSRNMRDMVARNRNVPHRGAANGNAKVSDATIREAVNEWRSGNSAASVARKYGIPESTFYNWTSGQNMRIRLADAVGATE